MQHLFLLCVLFLASGLVPVHATLMTSASADVSGLCSASSSDSGGAISNALAQCSKDLVSILADASSHASFDPRRAPAGIFNVSGMGVGWAVDTLNSSALAGGTFTLVVKGGLGSDMLKYTADMTGGGYNLNAQDSGFVVKHNGSDMVLVRCQDLLGSQTCVPDVYDLTTSTIAFTYGVPFIVDIALTGAGRGFAPETMSYDISANLTLSVLGNPAAMIATVPEPSAWQLTVVAGVIGLVVCHLRRRPNMMDSAVPLESEQR